MDTLATNRPTVQSLIAILASDDGMARKEARESLVALGRPSVASLLKALKNPRMKQVRWEAAKALGAIRDPRCIQGLVEALKDHDPDVAWLAAEALKEFGKAAWNPLLRALIKSDPDAVLLRQGAHHVLVNQKEEGFNDALAALAKDLQSGAVTEGATLAALEILERLKARA